MIIKLSITIFLIFGSLKAIAQDEYHNPVDGKTYTTEEWKKNSPKSPADENQLRVQNVGIRLLTLESDVAKNLSVKGLSGFIRNIEVEANSAAGDTKSKGVILLQVSLEPKESPDYKMSFQGDVSQEILQRFYDKLQALAFPIVRVSNVTFQVQLELKNA